MVRVLVLGVLVLLGAAGCAGFASDRAIKIEDTAHLYADCLRFGNVDLAATMVEAARRPDFLKFFGDPDERAIRFTSIDVAHVDVSPGAERATVLLNVRLYRLPSVSEISLTDRTEWRFDRKEAAWRVEPDLELYERAGR